VGVIFKGWRLGRRRSQSSEIEVAQGGGERFLEIFFAAMQRSICNGTSNLLVSYAASTLRILDLLQRSCMVSKYVISW